MAKTKKKTAAKKPTSTRAKPTPERATKGTKKSAARESSQKEAPDEARQKSPAPAPGGEPAVRKSTAASSTTPSAASAAQPAAGRLTRQQLEEFRKQLLDLRDKVVDGINFLANENLNNSQREASGDLSHYGIHMADQGTDAFDREFALNVVSNEQDLLYEIDEALHRIEAGTYGICELTGRPIEIERLRAVPYTRYCLAAQAELEKGRRKYRPMNRTGWMPTET